MTTQIICIIAFTVLAGIGTCRNIFKANEKDFHSAMGAGLISCIGLLLLAITATVLSIINSKLGEEAKGKCPQYEQVQETFYRAK